MVDFLDLKDGFSSTVLTFSQNKHKSVYTPNYESKTHLSIKAAAIASPLLLTPTLAFADTFGDIHNSVMSMFDGAVVLIIIFAGASWALGHRSKAIELLIGVCCGYLLARHAINIRDYLKSIG